MIIRPIQPHEVEALKTAAAGDDHVVLYPTHVVLKEIEGQLEIVGYGSICATPIVNVWMDSKKVRALDSRDGLMMLDAIARDRGFQSYIMPCAEESPYFKILPNHGFQTLGRNVWFYKSLTEGGK